MTKVFRISKLADDLPAFISQLVSSEKPLFFDTDPESIFLISSEKELDENEVAKAVDEFLEIDPEDRIKSEDEPIFESGDDYDDDDIILLS